MIQRLFYNFSIIFIVYVNVSCVRVEDFKNYKLNSTWDPSLAIPLVSSKIRLADAVNGADTNNIYVNSEGYYTIRYRDTVFTLPANDIFTFPDQNFSSNINATSSPLATLPTGSNLTVTSATGIPVSFTATGTTLNYMDISSGSLLMDLSSDFRNDVTIKVVFNGLSKNGTALTKQYDLAYNGSTPVATSDNIDLNGYTLSASSNSVPITITLTVKGKGNPVSPSEKITVSGKLSSLKYSLWVGNPGTFEIPVPEGKVQIGVFSQAVPKADVALVKPSIAVSFINSFGIPSAFGITKLYSNTAYEPTLLNQITTTAFLPNVSNNGNWTGFTNILAPNNPGSSSSATTSYVLDNTNSNITTIVNPAPKNIYYGTKLKVTGSSTNNYIRSDSKLSVFTKIELPLYGHISAYNLADTFNITLPSRDNVKQVTVRLFTDNSIPVKMNLQAYFLDSINGNLTIIDSLVNISSSTVSGFVGTPNETGAIVAEPAIYNNTGDLIRSSTLFKDFVYPYSRYQKIANCKKMILRGNVISSVVDGVVNYDFKITPTMTMTIKLSMKADLSFNP